MHNDKENIQQGYICTHSLVVEVVVVLNVMDNIIYCNGKYATFVVAKHDDSI